MAVTTNELAKELGVSERQVINYKNAVEELTGLTLTFRQGKQHFYHEQHLPLIRKYAKGEPLPQVQQASNPFGAVPDTQIFEPEDGAIVLAVEEVTAPQLLEVTPTTIRRVDTARIDAVTDRNQQLASTFMQRLKDQILIEADTFGAEVAAQVKQTVSRKVATAYRDLIR